MRVLSKRIVELRAPLVKELISLFDEMIEVCPYRIIHTRIMDAVMYAAYQSDRKDLVLWIEQIKRTIREEKEFHG